MLSVEDIADKIKKEAGWKRPPKKTDKGLAFELEGDVSFLIFKPADHLVAFSALIGPMPEEDASDEVVRRLARLAAVAATRRESVLSLHNSNFNLHRLLDLKKCDEDALTKACGDFLNDLDWWRGHYKNG